MNGHRLGLLSLRIDALYCAVLGASVAVAAPHLAPVVSLPTTVVAAIGGTVVAWAAVVAWMTARLPLRFALRLVMIANLFAAAAIAAFSVTAASILVLVSILAIAGDVGAFAGSQAVALTRLRTPPAVT